MHPPLLVYFEGTYDLTELSEAINALLGDGKNIIKKISLRDTDITNFVIVEIYSGSLSMDKVVEELLINPTTEKKFTYHCFLKYIYFGIRLYLKKYD